MFLALAACGCGISIREPQLHEPSAPVARTEDRSNLKVHLKSGELLVLDEWAATPGGDRLTGRGRAYTATREAKGEAGRQEVALEEVALLETSSPESVSAGGLGAIAVTTVVLGTLTGYCAVNPKGCFGSCPTFYVEGTDGREPDRPQAEGFSGSIARVLEARDLDALLVERPGGSRVAVTMRNEALETHSVRRVRLLAVPRPPGGRVLAGTDDRLYPSTALVPPLDCRAPEGDCTESLGAASGTDRVSEADGEDLAAREVVELRFPAARGPLGIVIGARQTLLSTFLFYQTMAYVGRGAGEFLAALERGGPEAGRRAMGMARVLGGIEVEVAEGGRAVAGDRELRRARSDRRRPEGPALRGQGRRTPARAAAPRPGALAPRLGGARTPRRAGAPHAAPAGLGRVWRAPRRRGERRACSRATVPSSRIRATPAA